MAMNYLQYIESVNRGANAFPELRFLVSGADAMVSAVVGQQVAASCLRRGKRLFLVDHNQRAAPFSTFCGCSVVNALDSELDLCGDLLEVDSPKQASPLRKLLRDFGFETIPAMRVITYLTFVREAENRLGNPGLLTADILEEYGSPVLVRRKLEQLVNVGRLSRDSCDYLLGRYLEVSSAAADFEAFLMLLRPFMGSAAPSAGAAVCFPTGQYTGDAVMQNLLYRCMLSYVERHSGDTAVLVLDSGKGDRAYLARMLTELPAETEVHFFTQDAFSMQESDLDTLMVTFPVRIYSRHENMASCQKIETRCGEMDVVKHSHTVTRDRRIRSNAPWDLLLGTNRTDMDAAGAPVKESRFRKEQINRLYSRTGIIDCCGTQVLYQF